MDPQTRIAHKYIHLQSQLTLAVGLSNPSLPSVYPSTYPYSHPIIDPPTYLSSSLFSSFNIQSLPTTHIPTNLAILILPSMPLLLPSILVFSCPRSPYVLVHFIQSPIVSSVSPLHPSVYLSICTSVCSFVRQSFRPSVLLSVSPSVRQFFRPSMSSLLL